MPDPDRSAIAAPRPRQPGAGARLVQYRPLQNLVLRVLAEAGVTP
jgi:hypothetical protein